MANDAYQPRQDYLGTGSVNEYTFDFLITNKEQLLIKVTDVSFVSIFEGRGSDTTYLSDVTFDSILGGGLVTLQTNLPAGYHLILLQADDAPTQNYEFKQKGDFTLELFTRALDAIMIAVQRLTYSSKRALKITDNMEDLTGFDPSIPITSIDVPAYGDRILTVNATATGFAFGPTASQIQAFATAAQASAAAASASEAAAAISETNALASQNSASLSAANAATSETNALAAQVAAEAAQAAAEAAAASIDVVPNISGNRSAPNVYNDTAPIDLPITSKYFTTMYIAGDAAPTTMTFDPALGLADNHGAKLRLIGSDNTNTLTLAGDDTGMELNGPITFVSGTVLDLEWDGTLNKWLECSRNGI